MRNFRILYILFLLGSCKDDAPREADVINEIIEDVSLMTYYKDTAFSELYVYPDTSSYESNFFFRGKQIDSITFGLLPEKISGRTPWREGFFGTFSFDFDSTTKGFITRVPGEYASTTISLWILNSKRDSLLNSVFLADSWGDGGDAQTTTSYLFYDNERQLKALNVIHTLHDHSLDDVEVPDSTMDERWRYSLLKITAHSIDTLSTDSSTLSREFKRQISRLASY